MKGEILLESLRDTSLLDVLTIDSVEEIKDDDGIWHVYYVSLEDEQMNTVGTFLKDGPWFMHFGNGNQTAVVFKDAVFRFDDADQAAIEKVKEHGRKLQIPEEELQFSVA